MITWYWVAWSNDPSPSLCVPRWCDPIPERIYWPAGLHEQMPHLPQRLARSKRQSGHSHCPASPLFLSPISKSKKQMKCNATWKAFTSHKHTLTHLYLLANIFRLCNKTEAESFGFPWQKVHTLLH